MKEETEDLTLELAKDDRAVCWAEADEFGDEKLENRHIEQGKGKVSSDIEGRDISRTLEYLL